MCQALYFLRHGPTTDVPPLLKGQSIDLPLSEAGRHLANEWAKKLTAIPFQGVVYSPLRRTQETAAPFLAQGLRGYELDAFAEVSWGRWEGLPRAEAPLHEQLKRWAANEHTWAPPAGESLEAIYARLEKGLALMAQLIPSGAVLLISHGYTLSLLLCKLLGYPPSERQRFHQPPATLSWGIRNAAGFFYLRQLAISVDDWAF